MAMSKQRKKMGKKLNYSIYIVCERTNTEPIYFKEIQEEADVKEKYKILVYPTSKKEGESIKTDAVNLVKIVKREREINDYDEVGAVFDKDGYTKHTEAFLYAKRHGVNLAFSSIAFEHWILLHYEQNRTNFPKSQNVIDYLKDAGYFTAYSKKANILIYDQLKDLTKTAIENAAWLRMEMAKNLAACDNKISGGVTKMPKR